MDLAHLVHARVVSPRRHVRSPAVQFLLLGGLLFAADTAWSRLGTSAGGGREIVLTATDVAQLRRGFEQQFGSMPNADEERSLVENAVDEEVLYRRALEIGLDRGNQVVRQRLIAIMRMLADDPAKDEDTLYREAIALRLDRSDVVVRRHLVQLAKLLLKRAGTERPVTDRDLEELLEREADRHRLPARLTLTQVYLDRARRGAELETDAAGILARLRSAGVDREAAPALGDPFLLGSRFRTRSETEIRRLLGDAFADAAMRATPGEWFPAHSPYGIHLVLVEERTPGRLPSVEAVRNQLVGRLREERGEEALRSKTAELRAQYAIRVERGADGLPAVSPVEGGTVLAVPRPARELGD